MTSKNKITLPKAVVAQLPPSEYFEVEAVDGRLMLTPVRLQKADAARQAGGAGYQRGRRARRRGVGAPGWLNRWRAHACAWCFRR